MHYEHLSYYWHVVKDALVLLVELLASLQDGLWAITQFASGLEDQIIEDGSVCEEYNLDDHFVG